MKTMIIVVFALLFLIFVLILYGSLVLASKEDDLMERMHIQWMHDHPDLEIVPKERDQKEEENTASSETEVLPP